MKKKLSIFLMCFYSLLTFANDSTYVERQATYIDVALSNNSGNLFSLKAYRGLPLDQEKLDELLEELPTKYDPDFRIVELIRVLFYADGIYDDDILPVLGEMPMWLNQGDSIRNYWTENHMIMWMSSEWLLHERYDKAIDSTLYPRLIKYLELKNEHGFYEFFSSVYAPYTLSGLLNLYDFTEDQTIKNLAMQVAQRLLKDILKPTTSLGVYFPAAGRNYPEKYRTAYGQNHNGLIYLLTGLGETPSGASHSGSFLATSNLPVDDVIASWTPYLDTSIQIGHPIESSFDILSDLSTRDRLLFQWTFGGYFHPLIAEESFDLLTEYDIWKHKDWGVFQPLSFISPNSIQGLAEELNVLSYSSGLTGHNLRIFKNNAVALISTPELWKGKAGFQQWPFAVTVGTTAVYIQAGKVTENWNDRDRNVQNSHLPHVEQNKNLALIMYRPQSIPLILDLFAGEMFEDKEVALFWKDDSFDEIVEDGLWLMARQDENYVAVRRSCTEQVNSWWACPTEEGQTWVIMVGNDLMYGSFSEFQNLIATSEFNEEWYYDSATSQYVYHSQISIDTLSAEYAWGVDSITTNIQSPLMNNSEFSIYPNPSSDLVNIELDAFENKPVNVKVFNALGVEIFSKQIDLSTSFEKIQTADWKAGTYIVTIENQGKYYRQKLVKF